MEKADAGTRVFGPPPARPFFQRKDFLIFERLEGAWKKIAKFAKHLFLEGNTRFHHLQSKVLIALKEESGYLPVRLFRSSSVFAFVTTAAIMGVLSNVIHIGGGHNLFGGVVDVFADTVGSNSSFPILPEEQKEPSLSLAPLMTAVHPVDPKEKTDTTVAEGTALSPENQMYLGALATVNIARDPEEDGGVKIYTVASGDTVSGIAAKFNITINTILWANNLDNVDSIRPGDQIFILPLSGFSYVVKSGDTIESIAAKYKGDRDRIIAFNGLPANGELTAGETIIIPDGEREGPAGSTTGPSGLQKRQYATSGGAGSATDISPNFSRPAEGRAGTGHRFPYGYCTWYVAQKRYVPWGGNAGTWLYNAKALGYSTGRSPRVGSIVVTTENRYYGHVALVEKVSGGVITVSEMNYNAWGKKDFRQLSTASRVIKGYIY